MLLQRSILLEVCLILAVTLVNARRYSYDKESRSSPDGAPSFDRVDYGKIFAAEASSPITYKRTKNGDVEIPDYEKIFAPEFSSASTTHTVKSHVPESYYSDADKTAGAESKIFEYPAYLKDFFEAPKNAESEQDEESRDEEVVRPGPSYTSHQVPAYPAYENDEEKSASDREDKQSEYGGEEGRVEKDEDDYKIPKFSLDPLKNNKQRVDYDTGKSSSTVSQYPEASEQSETAANTPYVKYVYHPPAAAEKFQAESSRVYDSAVGPSEYKPYSDYHADSENEHVYQTQPSEDVPTKFSEKNCKKISSEDDMNCFVCENPSTNAKYTQCNYKSKKEPVSFYEGNSAKYSMPHKGDSSRYKRRANEEEEDPYTRIKNRSLKSFDHTGVPSDFASEFTYQPEHYDETKPELTYSEQHAEDIKKNPDNCKKVDRKGMTCTVCKDPKTGGNFEQCSYTSSPQEKKYAYVTEKKYDNDEPEETKIVPETKTVELTGETKNTPVEQKDRELQEKTERVHQEKNPKKREEEQEQEPEQEDREEEREDSREQYESKPSEKKPVKEEQEEDEEDGDSYGYYPSSYSTKNGPDYSSASSESKYRYPEYDFDEYHYKLFPEFAKSESRTKPVKQTYNKEEEKKEEETYRAPDVKENYQIPEQTKQNVESVLAEFSKKDRSNCKKTEKKGMTCYLCVDKNNIQHEECMYVQESRPQSSHVAYHEVKAVKDKPEGIKLQVQPAVAESKRKHFFKKVTTPAPASLSAAASEQVGVVVKPEESKVEETKAVEAKAEESTPKEKRSSDETREESSEPKAAASEFEDDPDRINEKGEPTIHIPKLGTEEGVDAEETRPVYSKTLGVKLPKYMLDKSDLEKEFDEFTHSF